MGNAVLVPANISGRFVKPTEAPKMLGSSAIIFGVPGVGKTVFCASAADSPHGKKVLFIDVEGGTRSISDRKDVDVFRPSEIGEVKEVWDFLNDGEHEYKTIVIDTLNELQKVGLRDILRTAKDPEWPGLQDWGKSTEQMTRLVRAFRDLGQEQGINILFTAHANEQKDEVTGAVLIRPNLTPKATEAVCGIVDMVGYMRMTREGKRELLLRPTNTIVAKYRQPLTGPQLEPVIEEPNMVDILDHMYGGTA
jgi:phage nucleotide-binding protein